MKDSELMIDRTCHVIYSKKCKNVILKYISMHYQDNRVEDIFTLVQKQYEAQLQDYRRDLGGKKNFHNGVGGTYDNIMVLAYYVVCKDVTSFQEIEKLYEEIFIESFEKLKFVDCNKKIYKKLMYKAFVISKKKCDKWNDYKMDVEEYKANEPIRYKFTSCPVAEFARAHDLVDILPALCNFDYKAMELIHARLVRITTLGTGEYCDYTIVGDKDPYLKEHEEYRDEKGGRWNK